ncbi:MAG: helix-turn-helix transcriptional regulator, partial [Eubacterium sp.]|nr:helix-turn-helix transcriptional regulator [Eubacterium sp.]
MSENTVLSQLSEVASRIKGTREIMGWSTSRMAKKTEVTEEQYIAYESGAQDLPFTFIHKCALAFGIEITELLEGQGAHLSSFTVTRAGEGKETAKEEGITIKNLAHEFKHKIAEPYWVKYEYAEELQDKPIHLTKHSGQEFDLVISGTLKVQVGANSAVLHEGDSIYYNSSTPHGMIAIDGKDCVFLAVVLPGKETKEEKIRESIVSTRATEKLLCEDFIDTTENEKGKLLDIKFKNTERFNFAFD